MDIFLINFKLLLKPLYPATSLVDIVIWYFFDSKYLFTTYYLYYKKNPKIIYI